MITRKQVTVREIEPIVRATRTGKRCQGIARWRGCSFVGPEKIDVWIPKHVAEAHHRLIVRIWQLDPTALAQVARTWPGREVDLSPLWRAGERLDRALPKWLGEIVHADAGLDFEFVPFDETLLRGLCSPLT